MNTAERIAKMRAEANQTRAILDGIVLHPSDLEGRRQLAEQRESNRKVIELIDKIAIVFAETD